MKYLRISTKCIGLNENSINEIIKNISYDEAQLVK